MALRQPLDFLLLDNEVLFRFDCQYPNPRGGARFQTFWTDARNIEAHIVLFLCYFDGDRATVASGQLSAARQAFVRAFEAFNGQNRSCFDDDELADFQS